MLTNIYIQLLIIAGLLQDYQLRVHKQSVTAGLSEQLNLGDGGGMFNLTLIIH